MASATKTLSHLQDEYSEMVEAHNALCVKIADADVPNADDIHAAKMSEEKVKGHELLIENARRQQVLAADNAVGRLGGALRQRVADSSDGGAPAMFTSSSGRQVRMASGKAGKLSSGAGVPRNAVGELIRAAACGVRASTPQAVRMAIRSDENSAGGYAVPSEWVSDWVDRAVEISVLAPYASRMVMTAESSRVTTIESRPTIATKAQLSAFGNTGIVFGSRQLQAWTSGAVMKASMEMLQDSPNAAPQIESVALRAMADWFDRTMLAGTGSAEPLGLLNRDDLPGDTSAGLISWDLIGEAVAAIRAEVYNANAVILSPAAYSVLHLSRELTAGDGGYLNRPEHLRDLLILQTSHCPDDQALVGDLAQLLIGIREDMRVEASATAGDAFETNAMAIRIKMRGDFVPLDLAAFYRLDAVTLS